MDKRVSCQLKIKFFSYYLTQFQKERMSFSKPFVPIYLSGCLDITNRDDLRVSLRMAEQYLKYILNKVQEIVVTSDNAHLIRRAMYMITDIGSNIQHQYYIRKIYCFNCEMNGSCCNSCEKTIHYIRLAKTAIQKVDMITAEYVDLLKIRNGERERKIISSRYFHHL